MKNIPQNPKNGMQTIIPNEDFSTFSEIMLEQGFYVSVKQRYTDKTKKVELVRKTPLPDWENKSWEETRQEFLRSAQTDGKRALEGIAYGYLPETEEHDVTPWDHAAVNEEMEEDRKDNFQWGHDNGEYAWENFRKEKIRTLKRTRKKRKFTLPEKIIQRIKKWSKEFENYGITYEPVIVQEWGIFDCLDSKDLNLQGLYRRLCNVGILSRSKYINPGNLEDYVGHGFGLFNTGCTEFQQFKDDVELVRNKVKLNRDRTLAYVQESFTRGLMSPDVAYTFLHQIGFARNSHYQDLLPEERTDLVQEIIERDAEYSRQKIKSREEKAKQKRERIKRIIQKSFPYDLLEHYFGKLTIKGIGKIEE